ncbi:hypothetical protein [Catenulispora rubra]|uniref:hypothetical protein n=1 Tax=Catenulispora rubra TaxID=280293 RepID=UPI0018927667|nr:hypothetical protein [Catenulispora rubra]
MKSLISPRSVARLLAAATVVAASLAPITAAASTHDLCDGHKWSLFGCRHDLGQHRVHQPEASLPGSGLAVGAAARGPDGADARE